MKNWAESKEQEARLIWRITFSLFFLLFLRRRESSYLVFVKIEYYYRRN